MIPIDLEVKQDLYQENIKVYFVECSYENSKLHYVYTFNEDVFKEIQRVHKDNELSEILDRFEACYEEYTDETDSCVLKEQICQTIRSKYQELQNLKNFKEFHDDIANIPVGGLDAQGNRTPLHRYVPEAFVDTIAQHLINDGYKKQIKGTWIKVNRHRGGFRTVTITDSFGEQHSGMLDDRCDFPEYYCSICGKVAHESFLTYCASCGSKMEMDPTQTSIEEN